MWKLRCPVSVRLFIWLVLHETLLTNEFRYNRGLNQSTFLINVSLDRRLFFTALETMISLGEFGAPSASLYSLILLQMTLGVGFKGTRLVGILKVMEQA